MVNIKNIDKKTLINPPKTDINSNNKRLKSEIIQKLFCFTKKIIKKTLAFLFYKKNRKLYLLNFSIKTKW